MSRRNLRPYFTPAHLLLALLVVGVSIFSVTTFYQQRQQEAERAEAREIAEQQEIRRIQEEQKEAEAFIQQKVAAREQALGQRNQLILAIESLQKDVASFENRLHGVLEDENGRKMASNSELIRAFHRLQTGKRPRDTDVAALLNAIPEPGHYAPKDFPLFEPKDEDLRALQEHAAQVTNLRNLLVEDENTLAQLIRDAEVQEPSKNTLQDALADWREEVARRQELLEEHRRKQGDIIQTGAVFRGRYDYSGRSLDEPTSLYTLRILSRRGNGFEAKFTLERGVSIYSEGEIDADNVVFRNYSKKEEMNSRKSSKVDSIYRGKIDGVVWSGDCSYSTYRHEVQGTFYSQLIVDDEFMDVVYKPRDRFAIGAKWVGSVKHNGKAAEPMTLVINKRSRNLFRGIQLPSNAQVLTGSLDREFVRWSSLNEARVPVNYEGIRRDKVISGNATWLIDGVPRRATFELDFDCIEPRLWRLRD